MNPTKLMRTAPLAAVLALAGCGGGGGGGTPAPAADPGRTFFYASPVTAVDPADLTTKEVDAGTVTGRMQLVPEGDDAGGGTVSNLRPWAVIYARDGKIWRVDARRGADQTPVQVSSETTASVICDARLLPDPLAPERSRYVYELPGPDNQCNTQIDNPTRMVRADQAGDEPAQDLGTDVAWVRPVYRDDGAGPALAGALYLRDNELRYRDLATQQPETVVMSVFDAQPLAPTPDGGLLLRVEVGGQNLIRKFDPAVGQVVAFVFYGLPPGTALTPWAANGSEMFFFDGNAIRRVSLENYAPAQPVLFAPFNSPQVMASAGRVAVTYQKADNSTVLLTFDTTSYAAETWDTVPPGDLVTLAAVSDDAIYYNVGTDYTSGRAVRREAGAAMTFDNSLWTGVVNADSALLAQVGAYNTLAGAVTRVLRTDASGQPAVVVHEAASGTPISTSLLPAEAPQFLTRGLALDGVALGISAVTGDRHVVALRLDQDDSAQLLTAAPGQVNVAGGCTVGNGGFDPVLVLLLAAAAAGVAARRRRAG